MNEEAVGQLLTPFLVANHHGQPPFAEATAEATTLASRSKGQAVLLTPMQGGWGDAVRAAQEAKILQANFPQMSDSPLCKVAAIEIKVITSTKREGILRQKYKTGELRLLTAVEYRSMQGRVTGEEMEAVGGRMRVTPVYESDRDVIPAQWVNFPPPLDSNSALLQAELLEVGSPLQVDNLEKGLQDLQSKWRWFSSELAAYLLLCQRYRGRPLFLYEDYEGIMAFPRAYLQSLSDNLADQVDQPSGGRSMELLGELLESASLEEEEFLQQNKDEDFEEEDDEEHDYLELGDEVLRPPPLKSRVLVGSGQGGCRSPSFSATSCCSSWTRSTSNHGQPWPTRSSSNDGLPRATRGSSPECSFPSRLIPTPRFKDPGGCGCYGWSCAYAQGSVGNCQPQRSVRP